MIISVLKTFEEAKQVWSDFEKTSDCYVFQTYEWLYNWFKAVGNDINMKPCLVKVEAENGEPLMFLPLGIQKKYGVQCLTWMGGIVTDYHAPILGKNFSNVVDSVKFCYLWEQIKDKLPQFDVIHFEKQPGKICEQYNPFLYLKCHPFREKSYAINMQKPQEDHVESKAKKNIQADSRRQMRRLAKIGNLRFKVAGDFSDVNVLTSKMIEQKARRYQETGMRNLFEDDMYRKFYLNTAKDLVQTGFVHVSGLFLDDVIIAIHLGLIYRNRFYYLMPSFEGGSWARYSPGRLLLEYLIKWCLDNRIEVFDFTVGDDSYKYYWANQEMKLYEYYESANLKGERYILLTKIKEYLKKNSTVFSKLRRIKNSLAIK